MQTQDFTTSTTAALGRFGNVAHQAIEFYRQNGERIAAFANERWDQAFEQAKPQLDAETRENAKHAKDTFSQFYSRALELSADGATILVDTFLGATIAGVRRFGGNKPA